MFLFLYTIPRDLIQLSLKLIDPPVFIIDLKQQVTNVHWHEVGKAGDRINPGVKAHHCPMTTLLSAHSMEI